MCSGTTPTSNARTCFRLCATRHGWPRGRSFRLSMRHEGSGRPEPVASSGAVAFRCRLRGRALEFGRSATASDLAIMAHAKLHDFGVLTHDRDFGAILAATNADKPSVVQIRAGDLAPEALVGPLTIGLRQCERALADGALLTIDAVRLRLRLLPLNKT